MQFSQELQSKIDRLKLMMKPITLGRVHFDSPLVMAPLASITNSPMRLLMEDLGAGGTFTELISAHAIKYRNQKTLKMLELNPHEKNVGIQLFGEEASLLAESAIVAAEYNPKFIDINMGCPVKKVVMKGGGAGLMKDPQKILEIVRKTVKAVDVPISIKIRTGWCNSTKNAFEVVEMLQDEGLDFISIHGRTRSEGYSGSSDWDYIEKIAQTSKIPIIGNGDLFSKEIIRNRLDITNCNALMLARGPLRNPFLFLEAFDLKNEIEFTPSDYLEVIYKMNDYICNYFEGERIKLIQMRKHIVWLTAGFKGATRFRGDIFKVPTLEDSLKMTEDFFTNLEGQRKQINFGESFMSSGHG